MEWPALTNAERGPPAKGLPKKGHLANHLLNEKCALISLASPSPKLPPAPCDERSSRGRPARPRPARCHRSDLYSFEAFCRKKPLLIIEDPLFALLPPYRAIQRTVAAGGCLLLPKYPTLRTVAAARAWICPREGSELANCPPKRQVGRIQVTRRATTTAVPRTVLPQDALVVTRTEAAGASPPPPVRPTAWHDDHGRGQHSVEFSRRRSPRALRRAGAGVEDRV